MGRYKSLKCCLAFLGIIKSGPRMVSGSLDFNGASETTSYCNFAPICRFSVCSIVFHYHVVFFIGGTPTITNTHPYNYLLPINLPSSTLTTPSKHRHPHPRLPIPQHRSLRKSHPPLLARNLHLPPRSLSLRPHQSPKSLLRLRRPHSLPRDNHS